MIKMMLIFFMTMMSIMFPFMKHPMSFGLLILIQTLMMSMIMGLMYSTFWFSYIIFLIIIGALLILFIYMTNLVPNKKFNFSKLLMMFMLMLSMISMLYFYIYKLDLNNTFMFFKSKDMNMMNENNFIMNKYYVDKLKWIFEKSNYEMTMFLMLFMFYILIIIVTIVNKNLGMMRKI